MNIIETNLKFGELKPRTLTNTIILHHTATTTATPQQIHSWHLAKGWSGAGYHFEVRKDGNIYRLRPEEMIGAHAFNNNSMSIGIVFEGNFEIETMKEIQIQSGNELVNYLKEKWNIDKVIKHEDVNKTACPR